MIAATTTKRVRSTTKTLAPSAPKSPDLVIASVRHMLVDLEQLLDQSIKASGGPGDHTARLLIIGWDHLLPKFLRALQPDAFSAETVIAAIDVLHELQGVFVGVEAAERGAERGPIAQQAFNTVENVISMLDQPDLWPSHPTPSAEWRFEQGLNFARGCDLALELLRAQEASVGQDVCCWRRHREGRPQFRFWKPFIEQLVEAPELIDGFDAVMSASREDGMSITANELARVATEEYAAGEVGADGTVSGDSPESDQASSVDIDAENVSVGTSASPHTASLQLWREAMAAADLSTGDFGGDPLRGAVVLMDLAETAIRKATTRETGEDASLAMCYALAVLQVADAPDSENSKLGVGAAISLATIAKDGFDSAISELPREVDHA